MTIRHLLGVPSHGRGAPYITSGHESIRRRIRIRCLIQLDVEFELYVESELDIEFKLIEFEFDVESELDV